MSSCEEFREELKHVIQWNKAADFAIIHKLMHEGNYRIARWWARDIGLDTPPNIAPPTGVNIPVEQKVFLRQAMKNHRPTASGFPDHDFEPPEGEEDRTNED